MTQYYRPIVVADPAQPPGAVPLAGGPLSFTHVEVLRRDGPAVVVPADRIPAEALGQLTRARPAIAGLALDRPRIMGILNVTPDSFSDGGQHMESGFAHAERMLAEGADLIDVGGESTRPGAEVVPADEEIARTAPVIADITTRLDACVSIDTRKADVARAAVASGAALINDVAGFTYDPALAQVAAEARLPVCVMHAQGDPQTMQADPRYEDVLLDVYDFLAERVDWLVDQGVPRARILVDPGIGFGKTLDHNLALLRRISLFHALGCGVLLGVSRKRFIGTLTGVDTASERKMGSVAVAQAAWGQGIQIVRVHDVAETHQALSMWTAVTKKAANP